MSAVYWITGLSGAGKTTIGKFLYAELKEKYINTVFLDGDTLRQVFGNDLGYSQKDREICAMRYSRLCEMLQKQGLNVVCCTISMFDRVREWNRKHIENYREIYIKVSVSTLQNRDQKGLYSRYLQGKEQELAGFQVGMDEPKNPDLILENDGAVRPEVQAKMILNYFRGGGKRFIISNRTCPVCEKNQVTVLEKIDMKIPAEYHLPDSYQVVVCEECGLVFADTTASMEDYEWYYTNCNFYGDCSKDDNRLRFEQTQELLENHISKNAVILEMGAGNGRFSIALKKHGYVHVTATDPSEESVRLLQAAGIPSYVSSIYEKVPIEESAKYDGIFLFEVAEHLLLPGKGIENVTKMLKQDGVFIISVPDYSLVGEELNSIANYFNLEHINYFSEASLDYLLALHGMKRIDQKRVGIDLIQVYQKVNEVQPLNKDTVTEMAVRTYFQRQHKKEAWIAGLIEDLRKEEKELLIWGTGSYVMRLLATTTLLQCKIQGFIDNNRIKQGRSIYGYQIYPPEYLKHKKCTVLICSMLYGNEIRHQLEQMQTKNEIIVL